MHKHHVIRNDRQINLSIPSEILSRKDLTVNQKLLLGLDFALNKKLGFNSYNGSEVAKMLQINSTYVSLCRNQLVEKGLLTKNGRRYSLTGNALDLQKRSAFQYTVLRDLLNQDVGTGAKLLWSVYNQLSQGFRDYFAKRKTTATKLGSGVEAVSKWNRELNYAGLFAEYHHNSAYCTKQTVIITCSFVHGEPVREYFREKDYNGNWMRCAPLLGETG